MHEKPKLQCTRDYSIFEMHEFNRSLHVDPRLGASMKKHGFMASSPIQCVRNGRGTLKVIRGHHRLDWAKQLGLPVWYVIDASNTDIFDLEGGLQAWSIKDFAFARASAGDANCAKVLAFQKAHCLTLGAAVSLVGGESAGSGNKIKAIKDGTFKSTSDMTHANAVAAITDHCRDKGISFATASAFVSAVSLTLRVPEFDRDVFLHRVTINSAMMTKRSTVDAYLQEIEALYNYQAKGRRIPLAFRAREVSKSRQADFGGHRVTKKPHATKAEAKR